MPESAMLEILKSQLAEEALLQNWTPGYNLRQCQKPKQVDSGEVEYFFVVEGEISTESQTGDDQNIKTNSLSERGVAASP
jgi:hypothetical protein